MKNPYLYDHIRNPYLTRDEQFLVAARNAAETLWQACGGDVSAIPDAYLSGMDHSFSDGNVSLLSQLNKVEMGSSSYEEFSEVVEKLSYTDPGLWPDKECIESIPSGKLISLSEGDQDFDFSEWDFAEDSVITPLKMTKFLSTAISSVYTDGVGLVTDEQGKPPSKENNFLLDENGNFTGIFYDVNFRKNKKKYPFVISSDSKGEWEIKY